MDGGCQNSEEAEEKAPEPVSYETEDRGKPVDVWAFRFYVPWEAKVTEKNGTVRASWDKYKVKAHMEPSDDSLEYIAEKKAGGRPVKYITAGKDIRCAKIKSTGTDSEGKTVQIRDYYFKDMCFLYHIRIRSGKKDVGEVEKQVIGTLYQARDSLNMYDGMPSDEELKQIRREEERKLHEDMVRAYDNYLFEISDDNNAFSVPYGG